MEFIHKLFDSGKKQYIMGYNYMFVLVMSGDFIFPLFVSLWLPKPHVEHRSKNDILIDFIKDLDAQVTAKHLIEDKVFCKKLYPRSLSDTELTFDSAFCVQKVMQMVTDVQLRVVTKANNNHKFEFEGQSVTPSEIIEFEDKVFCKKTLSSKIKNGHWKPLGSNRFYQLFCVNHHNYGEVVLIVRKKTLKTGKIIHDVLLCNQVFYNAHRIDKCYLKRWNIEMQFKYYKQHLNLGKSHFRTLGAIQSSLYCVAIVGLLVALYCRSVARNISFKRAVKQIMSVFTTRKPLYI
jgi:hypothetical protein